MPLIPTGQGDGDKIIEMQKKTAFADGTIVILSALAELETRFKKIIHLNFLKFHVYNSYQSN